MPRTFTMPTTTSSWRNPRRASYTGAPRSRRPRHSSSWSVSPYYTLLRSRRVSPYYALVAFETGGVPRLALLLLLAPLVVALYYGMSVAAGVQVLVFAATAGARVMDIEATAWILILCAGSGRVGSLGLDLDPLFFFVTVWL